MLPPLTEKQVKDLVRVVAARVAERLATEAPGRLIGTPAPLPDIPRPTGGSIMPCAIPPPGSQRYEQVMREIENEGGELGFIIASGANRVGRSGAPTPRECRALAPHIDHTLLRSDATPREIERLCEEAIQWGFAAVCVNSSHVALCARTLRDTPVKVCAVVGFPLGAMTPAAKAFETREAIAHGAGEIDMVLPVGRLKARDYKAVLGDIRAVVEAAQGRPVKVILETALLSDEEKVAACVIAREAGAHYVKTSTGFASAGATAADVALMRRVVGPGMGVKASGGIRDCPTALAMSEAGADRIGASASVSIVRGN